MKKITLKIEGMTCSACSNGLEKHLNKQKGIVDAVVNLVLGEAAIKYEENLSLQTIEQYIEEAGFKSLGESTKLDMQKSTSQEKKHLILLGIILVVLVYLSMGNLMGLPTILDRKDNPYLYVSILFVLTMPSLVFNKNIFKNGLKNIKNRMPNMDSLVSIGVLASLFSCVINIIKLFLNKNGSIEHLYLESIAMILFFVKLGRFLDKTSKTKTVEAIEELVQITPEKALLKVGEKEQEVTIDEIKEEDILVAKPGMKIAVDGIIIKGSSHLDESFITGESIPVKKKKGNMVIAGSFNYDGLIEYQAKKIGKNSTISEIVHLVVDATNTKAPIAQIADKISGYFVPFILIVALLTFMIYLILGNSIYESLEPFVTVLVVACPCALGLATPLSVVVATGFSAKRGILIKNSEILEIANKVDVIIFDKTGTLTKGELEISKVITQNVAKEQELLQIAASIENASEHPIRQAFLKYIQEQKINLINIEKFQNLEGIGITAKVNKDTYYLGNNKLISKLNSENPYTKEEQQLKKTGNSIIYIIKNKQVIALIGVKDQIKKESNKVITELKKHQKEIIMLTGDNKEVANKTATELGITEVIAEVTPKEKREIINKFKNQGKKVMMIGDGINDAPSLAQADIGASFQGATDIAANSANVIFLKNDLTSILDLIIISKETLKNIHQNLFWAFIYNVSMIPIATGILKPIGISINPMIASITMTLSSLTVVFNALRLNKINLSKTKKY